MAEWTLTHRLGWLIKQMRAGGLPELRRRVGRYVSPAARAARRQYLEEAARFDADNGYRTCGVVAIEDLTLAADPAGSIHYEGTAIADITRALDLLDLPVELTTFVDVGCGMARPLLMAADRPFKKLVGVDFALELLAIARHNFDLRASRCGADGRVELVHADAADLPIPPGPVAFFFFNSFGPLTLGRLLTRIHASWRADPRPVRFIYVNIQHYAVVEAAGFRANAVAPDYHFTIFEPVAST